LGQLHYLSSFAELGVTWNLATDAAEGPESLEVRDPDGHVLRVFARERAAAAAAALSLSPRPAQRRT
jgi:hypothetical protein